MNQEVDPNRIVIFDTTLRDGEQCPGASMNLREKLEVARQLTRLGVDVIEAGFPISSVGDFEAVQAIAREIQGPIIAGLARCIDKDIDRAAEAIEGNPRPRIHAFLATSEIHRQFKLRMARPEIIRRAVAGVERARSYVSDVEFSPEDASRTEPEFLAEVVQAVIDAGATTVNIPDTVGYALPSKFGDLIKYLFDHVNGIERAIISVHCHNDLGLAVANSLAAIEAGARQVECTINGLGERAGNASLEEIAMAIKTRHDHFTVHTDIKTEEIVRTSKLVSHLTGMVVQRNKAIVGQNAFAHEAGIHQDGLLKERSTYEIIDPASVGWTQTELVLGKHSGRHAFRARLEHLGYQLDEEEIQKAFIQFKALADKKKLIYDEDLIALAEHGMSEIPETYTLDYLSATSGAGVVPTATVRLKKSNADLQQDAACGDGPVDAALNTIERITGVEGRLVEYSIRSVTMGKDALGEVSLKARFAGNDRLIPGKAASTDIIEASAKAYLHAINRFLYEAEHPIRQPKDQAATGTTP
ncbi:MAG: 2-isopropylmalate synthase [Verrucomicrobiota bacterium]|nr:2-isopropylmalate synthase [Verrucomicrobiota bacterium]MDD8045878.1 2-isopropylmalate synthase [Verrucomicrobiota bacterium]MDD8050687.1 2-isopropylmalate synthase [Verrucomicrobiota bacterium]MDI9384534.1 2-isopropylmalate synthase [Verrucomicrobiota bacterium]HCF94729.1 2-isopropylmalate synthase [Verrucomicrobiota bacterium]